MTDPQDEDGGIKPAQTFGNHGSLDEHIWCELKDTHKSQNSFSKGCVCLTTEVLSSI